MYQNSKIITEVNYKKMINHQILLLDLNNKTALVIDITILLEDNLCKLSNGE